MLNSITEIDRKGLFGRQASGLLSQEGDRIGQDLVAGIELNAIARVGQDLDHKAFELDEFFLGHRAAPRDPGSSRKRPSSRRRSPARARGNRRARGAPAAACPLIVSSI